MKTRISFRKSNPGICLYTINLFILLLSAFPVRAASLQRIVDFGDNPSNLEMYLYVPDDLPDHVPVIVGLHWCHGTANDYFNGNKYRYLADEHKFIVIYPDANSSDSCFDVHSEGTLTHNGGGDSKSIISMVRYVLSHYSTDSNRVFVTGHSSGGMMTNVMAGSYPEVFAAASASAGVPFGCFAGTNTWNSDCAEGRIDNTPREWGDIVRGAYPAYNSRRPRMQLWHGTNDNVLRFHNFGEAIEQWTDVLRVGQTPSSTEQNTPMSTYIRTRYNDPDGNVMVEAIEATGEGHNCRIDEEVVISFFGLDQPPTEVRQSRNDQTDMYSSCRLLNRTKHGFSYTVHVPLNGTVRIGMYSLHGRRIAMLYDANLIKGTFVEKKFKRVSTETGIAVIAVSVDGIPVESRIIRFF
jgi:acetylxylan esterase